MGLFDFLSRKNKPPLILIVDDDMAVRGMLRSALEDMGYSVIEAANGKDGIESAKSRSPQLILMDVVMPQMTGLQALAVLKSDRSASSIPVLMVTAQQKGDDVETAFQKGAAGYVIKPFNMAQLREKVQKILPPPKP